VELHKGFTNDVRAALDDGINTVLYQFDIKDHFIIRKNYKDFEKDV
jgi:hypothetical protein